MPEKHLIKWGDHGITKNGERYKVILKSGESTGALKMRRDIIFFRKWGELWPVKDGEVQVFQV